MQKRNYVFQKMVELKLSKKCFDISLVTCALLSSNDGYHYKTKVEVNVNFQNL